MDNNILPENEFKNFEGRNYLNPNIAVQEANSFIDNFRTTQRANNAQINQQTRSLGAQVPSNLGGLTGGTGYFTSRYQTPQTNAALQNLRTAAQASALNTALSNEQAMWKKRYQDAYNAYQKRMNDKANTAASGGNLGDILKNLGIDTNTQDGTNMGVNENTTTTGPGYVSTDDGSSWNYVDNSGNKWNLGNLQEGDDVLLGGLTHVGGNLLNKFPDGTPLTNGAVYDAGGGRVFMFVQNSQYPNGAIFRVSN